MRTRSRRPRGSRKRLSCSDPRARRPPVAARAVPAGGRREHRAGSTRRRRATRGRERRRRRSRRARDRVWLRHTLHSMCTPKNTSSELEENPQWHLTRAARPYHAPPAAPRRPPGVAPAPLQVEDLALRGHARLHEPCPDAAHPRPPRPRRLRRRHGGLRRHLLLHDQARLVRPGHPRRRPAQARGQGRRERRRRGAASERARRARAARAAPGGGVDFAVRGARTARIAHRRPAQA